MDIRLTSVWLTLVVIGFARAQNDADAGASAQAQQGGNNRGGNNRGGQYDYENPYANQKAGNDYSIVQRTERPPINCYTCHLHVHKGHEQGMPNCDHRFVAEGIPTVPCAGPCAKIFQKVGDDEFLLTRNCVPNCKEFQEDGSYVECCSTTLCNAGPSSAPTALLSLTAAVATALAIVLLR